MGSIATLKAVSRAQLAKHLYLAPAKKQLAVAQKACFQAPDTAHQPSFNAPSILIQYRRSVEVTLYAGWSMGGTAGGVACDYWQFCCLWWVGYGSFALSGPYIYEYMPTWGCRHCLHESRVIAVRTAGRRAERCRCSGLTTGGRVRGWWILRGVSGRRGR